MRKQLISCTVLAAVLVTSGLVLAHDDEDKLPPGPIRDRHELMEGIGKNAKTIGDAMKSGKLDPVADAADKIHASAGKVVALFPKGSSDPASRAKPEIWEQWDRFEKLNKDFEAKSAELAAAAKSGGDVGAAAKAMFGACKSCHDDFRKPEEKKGEGKS